MRPRKLLRMLGAELMRPPHHTAPALRYGLRCILASPDAPRDPAMRTANALESRQALLSEAGTD